ncbi:hypothetical protein KC571_01440 [candidate division WWE3 bacterium]|uniref:Uncharacterized protein n=1 Tax=candidate division WWE3 bacterium TaxID=2053526 RepID=A0A955RQ21_UNCKA|nr:hypothetical protein [candidate division WWE3 bacterium]
MQVTADLSPVRQVINNSYKIVLVTKDDSQGDVISAQHLLAEVLNEKGKEVLLSPSHENYQSLPKRSATLRFKYEGDKIERLQYRIREDEVELTFTPFSGTLAQENISVEYPTFNADTLIAVGVQSPHELPKEFLAFGMNLDEMNTINIDNHSGNTNWGKLNVVMQDIPLYSLLVAQILSELGMDIRDYWQQLVLVETKEKVPQLGNASPRLLRLVADLADRPKS